MGKPRTTKLIFDIQEDVSYNDSEMFSGCVMQMFEEDEGIVFELTSEETDQLFEPFDPTDRSLTGLEFSQRKRFLREEYREWFDRMIGQLGKGWWHKTLDPKDGSREIWFADKKGAMKFKLFFFNTSSTLVV